MSVIWKIARRLMVLLALVVVAGWTIVSILVELEAPYKLEDLGGRGPLRALVLYHPSRDASFTDDLSSAFSDGLKDAGFRVDRATLTSQTSADPGSYVLIAVVSNTYYWTPDLPTLRYLKRARWMDTAVVGLIGGAGSTGRSQRVLHQALVDTGARVLATHPYWLWRPNDETRLQESNRAVALDLARRHGRDAVTAMNGASGK